MSYIDEINNKIEVVEEYPLKPTDMSRVTLRMETTNFCNHRCQFCPNSKLDRKKSVIDKELAMRVIDEAADMGVKRGAFFLMGEPLLCKDIFEYYRHAKFDKHYEFLFLTTNGTLATKDKVEEMLECGVDSIKFSINAGSPETYKKVHGRDDYDKAMEALRYACEYRNKHNIKCRILSSYIVTKDNVDEVQNHYTEIKDYVDDFAFFGMNSFAGSVADETENLKADFDKDDIDFVDFPRACPCQFLNNSINVNAEGYLTCCVDEHTNLLAVEDLNKMSLREAWYSDRMVNARKRHREKDIKGMACYNCVYGAKEEAFPLNNELYMRAKASKL